MPIARKNHSRYLTALAPAFLVLAAAGLAFYKIAYLDYDLSAVNESESYYIETVVNFEGHGSDVDVSLALPRNDRNQTISDEAFGSNDLRFKVESSDLARFGVWHGDKISGSRTLKYTGTVFTKEIKFGIDSLLPTRQSAPKQLGRLLLADSLVQSDDPEVAMLADSLGLSEDSTILSNLQKSFDYVTHGLKYVQYSGTTDALTAHHLGEASCGGKARLFAALTRHLGIPTRLVGGKILSSGQSKATHIWAEAYVYGHWVPFCPTNNYFAEIPSTYLVLYYGDLSYISHSRDINFKYFFNLKKRLVSNAGALPSTKSHPLNVLNIWGSFQRVAISLELLKIIIMLPIGVLVVVLCRNIIGIETFGTFMPALIAVGFRDTGLWEGIVLFAVIVIFGALVRSGISRLQLLHTPRLAIILSAVVLFILGVTAVGVQIGWLDFARVALFPMVILTLTVERFSLITEEHGLWHAVRVSILTIAVASITYVVMSSRTLQSIVITFPEAILILIALYIYIGRYSGFRITEYSRFRHLFEKV